MRVDGANLQKKSAFQTAGERPADLGNMSIRPAVRCGRRAAVRLLGARDGGRGAAAAAAALSAKSRKRALKGGGRKKAKRDP